MRLLIERGADFKGKSPLGIPLALGLDAALVDEAGVREIVGQYVQPDRPAEEQQFRERLKAAGPVPPMKELMEMADRIRKAAPPQPPEPRSD